MIDNDFMKMAYEGRIEGGVVRVRSSKVTGVDEYIILDRKSGRQGMEMLLPWGRVPVREQCYR